MNAASWSQLFLLYSWFGLAALVLFLILIARFYRQFSGEWTGSRFFIVPLVGFGIVAVRYATIDRIGGDLAADLLAGVSGLILLVLSARLYRQMTAGRRGFK
jgi:phosphoglycerol transferase MdoB-like AlkP superfamily enzyme